MSAVIERVRAHLQRHPTVAYRPVPLASAIRERDIRQVRAALRRLADAGEAVTCKVIKDGVEETEYRISCGGPTAIYRPVLHGMNDRPVRRSEVGGSFVERNTCKRPADGRGEAPLPASKDSIEAGAEACAEPATQTPAAVTGRARRGLHRGRAPVRQDMIVETLEKRGAPMSSRDLIEAFTNMGEQAPEWGTYSAVSAMAKKGDLVQVGTRRLPPDQGGHPARLYVTRTMAESGCEWNATESGGEAFTGKAGETLQLQAGNSATCAPVEKTAPDGAGVSDAGPQFGFLENGALAIRAPEVGIDLSPSVSRALLTWLSDRAGVNLVAHLQGALK